MEYFFHGTGGREIYTRLLSILLLSLLFFLQACATKSNPRLVPVEDRTSADSTNDQAVDISVTEGREDTDGQSSPAVLALLENARHDAASGRREAAAATIERALRLEPKNALLWHRLASLKLQQGHREQALNLARKSNTLAAGNQSLQVANWQVIARVKEQAGDKEGLRQARQMIERLN